MIVGEPFDLLHLQDPPVYPLCVLVAVITIQDLQHLRDLKWQRVVKLMAALRVRRGIFPTDMCICQLPLEWLDC